jgi:hypothetical protein
MSLTSFFDSSERCSMVVLNMLSAPTLSRYIWHGWCWSCPNRHAKRVCWQQKSTCGTHPSVAHVVWKIHFNSSSGPSLLWTAVWVNRAIPVAFSSKMTKTWKCLDTLVHRPEGASDNWYASNAGIDHRLLVIGCTWIEAIKLTNKGKVECRVIMQNGLNP